MKIKLKKIIYKTELKVLRVERNAMQNKIILFIKVKNIF
jgi:hypothetical protein